MYLDTILLRYLVLAGKMEEVERIYRTTKEKGVVMYVSLLGSLAKVGRKEEIERVVEDMNKDGVPPVEASFNSRISTHGLSFAESWELFNEMKAKNISPTIVTYNILIDQCGFNNQLEMIEKILLEIKAKGIEMDPNFHKSVSEAYHRCGRTDLAVDYILQMKRERGVLLKGPVSVLLVLFKSETLRSSMALVVMALNRTKSDTVPPNLTKEVLRLLSDIKTEALERLSIKE